MYRKFKRFLSVMLVFVLCFVTFCSTNVVFAAGVKGDVNGDGSVKTADARLALQYAAGLRTLTSAQLSRADYDDNGDVDIDDARLILKNAIDIEPVKPDKFTQYTPSKQSAAATKVKYCQVTEYGAETLASSPIDDKSIPLYSNLPKGTYDYISSGPVTDSESGKSYYVLKSGRRVYDFEVKTLTGYVMPDNKAKLNSFVEYTKTATDLYMALSWRVPFNVQIKPQSYETGYDGRPYNNADDKFTGQYMDITFFYTAAASGTPTFPDSDTIKSCKWIMNADKKTATLRIYFRESGGFYGYTAYYNSDNYLIISIKEPVTALKGRTIMIDPGHGGYQPGAGSGTGVYEKNITYKIATLLKTKLEKAGATVVMTRDDSASVPEIEERRMTAMEKNPDLFVSIHLDANDSRSAHGSSVYYYKNYSGPLALAISKAIPSTLSSELGYSMTNRGAHFYPFCVARIENCPSVLVECGFITNTTGYSSAATNYEAETCPYAEPSATLRQGDTGTGVKWLQWHLYKLGYLTKTSDIDGDFGPTTLAAVKKFQAAKGLEADGLVGSATRSALKTAYPTSSSGGSSGGTGTQTSATCDFALLNSSSGQTSVANGIYKGVINYFGI